MGAVAAALTFGVAMTAYADIVVTEGVNNQGTDNVLLNPADDATTVTGTVGPTNALVNFTSTGGTLDANPSGQATISAGSNNDPYNNLSFALASGNTFTRAVFNIDAANDGTVVIHVEGINITGGSFSDDFAVDANGQNFFTVTAINGQLMTSISLTGQGDTEFSDVQQVRIGGVAAPIPEPETYALMMAGLGAIGFMARRRKKAS